MHNKRDITAK